MGSIHSPLMERVVVRFAKYKGSECVPRQAREKKSRGIFFNEDVSAKIVEKRKALSRRMKEARRERNIAYISFNEFVTRDALVAKYSAVTTYTDCLSECLLMEGQSYNIERNTVSSLPCYLWIHEQVGRKIYFFDTHFHLLSVNLQIYIFSFS